MLCDQDISGQPQHRSQALRRNLPPQRHRTRSSFEPRAQTRPADQTAREFEEGPPERRFALLLDGDQQPERQRAETRIPRPLRRGRGSEKSGPGVSVHSTDCITGEAMKLHRLIAVLLAGASALGFAESAARVVHYHANDIVAIRAKMRYTTLVQVPAGEKIMEAATGDKDFWIIEAVQNYCFLHPAKPGIHSNLKVMIEPSDPSMLSAIHSSSKFIPAGDVDVFRTQAMAAQLDAGHQLSQFRSEYPTKSLKFDYFYRSQKPFNVEAIYHDADFTYVKSTATEKFAVYELKDGKPNSISYELRDSTYVIPKVVDQGYLQIGKKHMNFTRREQ